MADLNTYSCTGRLGRDPETRFVADTSVTGFSLAVDDSYKKNGQKVDQTVWIDVELWGGLGEIIAQYAGKGSRLGVTGSLKLDQWDDKTTGQKRSKIKLRGMTAVLLDPKPDGARRSARATSAGANASPGAGAGLDYSKPPSEQGAGIDEDSIPFAADPLGGFGW